MSADEVRKAQEAWARYLGRQVEVEDQIAPGVKMKFVLVPAGKFLMGSSRAELDDVKKMYPLAPKDFDDEAPQHEVTITQPFYLGRYHVTQEQWEDLMGNNPSCFYKHGKGAHSVLGSSRTLSRLNR